MLANKGVSKVIAFGANYPWLVICLSCLLGVGGFLSMKAAPLDAVPDLSEVQVTVLSEWAGQSPDRVEDQITYPLSSAMLSAPKASRVRSQSSFGLSFVTTIFEPGTDLYWARARTQELLSSLRPDLPVDASIELGPDASGVGWVLMYALVDEKGTLSLADLRSLQDWDIRTALSSVSGVSEVASIGGQIKTYEVTVNPSELRRFNLSMEDIVQAIEESNDARGGGVIEIAAHEHMIRSDAYLESIQDFDKIPLRVTSDGLPITLGMIAETSTVPGERRGLADWNGKGETVGGIIVMRDGENALTVCDAVHERLDVIRRSLPEGVKIEVAYDRSEFINSAVNTLKRNLLEEILIVGCIIALFLGRIRSSFVVCVALPTAIVLSFIPIYFQGFTLNIMSLGGIAVAIGAMVDASIVLLDNVQKKSEDGPLNRKEMIVAMQEVGPTVFFSLLIMSISFLPILFLEGVEGRLFRPLAFTKTYAMLCGAGVAVFLLPALCVLLYKRGTPSHSSYINRALIRWYSPIARRCSRHPYVPIILALIGLGVTVPVALSIQTEFMPPLNEGSLLYMPSAPPGISMTEAGRTLQNMDVALMEIPEVKSVFGKMGRANTATDPSPLGMAETTIALVPRSEWREGLTWNDLVDELDQSVQIPGMPNLWWMPIQTRLEMLNTGIRAPLAVQVFANDPAALEKSALVIESALKGVGESRSVVAERTVGASYVDFDIDRDRAAQLGVRVSSVLNSIDYAIGGKRIGTLLNGRERFPIRARYARDFREDLSTLDDVLVDSQMGPIPISEVSSVVHRSGPSVIRSENAQLQSFVFIDLKAASTFEFVEAGNTILSNLRLPDGVRWSWAGQFEHIRRAKEKLLLVVPICLVMIVLLLYINTGSMLEVSIVLLAIPFSLIGAVWFLHFLGYQWSVATAVGLIALAGLDAETGMVMLLYLKLARRKREEGHGPLNNNELEEAIVEGAAHRIRPKLMTVLTSMLGLLPILWSEGPGADMMKRVAAPMVGGLGSSFLLELCVYPALFALWHRKTEES
jgi:copper/silver efflux system protein